MPALAVRKFIEKIASLERGTGFPWPSAVALVYPLGAAIDIATAVIRGVPLDPEVRSTTMARLSLVAGYGLGNLGYLLFAAAIWPGSFRILGLKKRWQVVASAVLSLIMGVVLGTVASVQPRL
jgi:hypothetical protein